MFLPAFLFSFCHHLKMCKTINSYLVCMQHWIKFNLKKLDPVLAIPEPKYMFLQRMFALSFLKHYNLTIAVY